MKCGQGLPCSRGDSFAFVLAQGELDTYEALALIYTGKVNLGVDELTAVIAKLSSMRGSGDLADHGEIASFDNWRLNLVLGLAHNNLGYAHRRRLGRYKAALDEYGLAIPFFRAANMDEWVANVSDNAGRTYALTGNRTLAELLVDNALELRRHLGRELSHCAESAFASNPASSVRRATSCQTIQPAGAAHC